MKNLTLSDERVKTIHHKHMHAVDKLCRMHAGISSELIAVKNGIACLEVNIHSGWKKPHEVTINQFITSWTNHISELKEIDGWQVRIYTSENIAGFTVSPSAIDSPLFQNRLDLLNAEPEQTLIYVYNVYLDSIKHPVITLKDTQGKFNLEFPAHLEVVDSNFFCLNTERNYVVYNKNISGNIFINPDPVNDYLLITEAEYGQSPEIKHIQASQTPVTYSYHSKLLYLINLSRENTALLFWKAVLNQPLSLEAIAGTRNC